MNSHFIIIVLGELFHLKTISHCENTNYIKIEIKTKLYAII